MVSASPFRELVPGIWVAPTSVGWFTCHCIALQGEHDWQIYGAGVNLSRAFLEQFGPETRVSRLLIPNSFHYLGIQEWLEVFPDAVAIASKSAMQRVTNKGVPSPTPLEGPLALPHNGRLLELPHSKIGELWLSFHEQSPNRGLCVGDAFFCLDKAKDLQSWLIQNTAGISDCPAVSRLFKWYTLSDRKEFYAWAKKTLSELDPQLVVPQHGTILRGEEVPKLLHEALDRRF